MFRLLASGEAPGESLGRRIWRLASPDVVLQLISRDMPKAIGTLPLRRLLCWWNELV